MAIYWKIMIGLVLGIVWAIVFSHFGLSSFNINYVAPIGDMFMRFLQMIAAPLVFVSIVLGITGLKDASKVGKLGVISIFVYVITLIVAIVIGLTLSNIFRPGDIATDEEVIAENRLKYETWAEEQGVELVGTSTVDPALLERVKSQNPQLETSTTNSKYSEFAKAAEEKKEGSPLQSLVDMVPSNLINSFTNNQLLLQVIFLAVFMGIVLFSIPQKDANRFSNFCSTINSIIIQMIHIVMKAAPFFVFALMVGAISEQAKDDVSEIIGYLKSLSAFSLTVIGGLLAIMFVLYTLLIHFIARVPVPTFFRAIFPAQAVSFSLSSSSATLPVTIDCVENNLKVDSGVAGFVLPLGATINMDGTSLYQAVTVLFLAQFHGIELAFSTQVVIVLMSVMAAIGTAGVPGASLIMIIVVMQTIGLNPAWIVIVFPVDRILDMARTTVNVTGDALVATIIDRRVKL